ncbi:MATH and LRR domain-containing protein PFE0570w-like isoform X1 [Diorhabda carinulata]|uniref:MATH and LRR domain-containing protein PFE0570w-like isoform X1 n=2 Tax=Diorhabda carinulata TaxID=1163345 RepID=UPI0025A282B7|nr:MATH and LRR domain-containing protein PFE0570w-like isoform X1 [Diorhabda carinulata]
MEPLDLIAAKLVLGYLKSAKCITAHREFLRTSSNLRHLDSTKTKYMPTRFLGQTLEDILVEYFQISQIIQGRLEATDFYNENHSNCSLQNQLLYLLNNKVPSSRASTPIASTPYGSCDNCTSPNNSDLDATPIHTLPGNAESEESFNTHTGSKRKLTGKNEEQPLSSSKISPNEKKIAPTEKSRTEVFDTEVLAQNLMENKEFQEKIAHTINKVVERQYKERNPEELDKTIKSAVEEAQADPIFDDLLREIMGSSNMVEANKHSEVAHTTSNTGNKKDTTDLAKSKSANKSDQAQGTSNNIKAPHHYSSDKETMSFDNSFNNYIISNNCSLASTNPCVQNPIFINTVSGLLIPSVSTSVNPTKPLILLNNPTPVTTTTTLTEQDIMQMPIIIHEKDEMVPLVVETGKQKKGPKKPKMILPQPTIQLVPEASTDLQNYFKNFTPPENQSIEALDVEKTSSAIPDASTSKRKTGLKKVLYPKAPRKSPRPKKRNITTTETKKVDPDPTVGNNSEFEEKNRSTEDAIVISSKEKIIVTPASSDNNKMSTPKSTSHVRNLNFSSPPKNQRKSNESNFDIKQNDQAVKTLFTKAWDADLRAVIPNQDNEVSAHKKQQLSSGNKKLRKKIKINSKDVTEKEGRLLETAIKTPIKHDDKNSENKSVTECFEDNNQTFKSQVKTILSPSKLHNTSKNILEAKSDERCHSKTFVTPDMLKESVVPSVTTKRNIMPILETPIKVQLPKTPGISTPLDVNMSNISTTTPFTKMLEANLDLKSIDIDSIPTPNLPITPNFVPFTPRVNANSPYSSRPTDYSTSSSYYQPSDNEQNKNLEAHLREIEKASPAADTTVDDHLQLFNKNVIGKKNLNLMKTNMKNDDSFDSSSTEEGCSSDEYNKESNDTVIFRKNKDMLKRTYPLRNRSKNLEQIKAPKIPIKSDKSTKISNKGTKTENISSTTNSVEDISKVLQESKSSDIYKPIVKGVSSSQLTVLKDLESKRLRMVNSLKPQIESNKTKKPQSSKFKIKPIAKVYTTKKNKKSESPKKKKRERDIDIVLKDLITSDDSDTNIMSTNSDDDDKTEKADKTASDAEAQNLIQNLKERGIHLVQNKSSKKINANHEYQINTSGTQMEMLDRNSFDLVNLEECIEISHNEEENESRKMSVAASKDTKKVEYIGQLYLESIGGEVEIHLKQTDFYILIDIEPSVKNELPSQNLQDRPNKTEKQEAKDEEKKKRRISDKVTNLKKNKKESKLSEIKCKSKSTASEIDSTTNKKSSDDIKLNEKQSTKHEKVQMSELDTKSSKKKSKEELIEKELLTSSKLNKTQSKDVKVKKENRMSESKSNIVNKPKQSTNNTEVNETKSLMKNSDNKKEVMKKHGNEAKQTTDRVSSDNKRTKQKCEGNETNDNKKDNPLSESKMELPIDGGTCNTSENEKNKSDHLTIESKETKNISSMHSNSNERNCSLEKDIEDELMNFASTGKVQEDALSKSVSKKRRTSDEILIEHSCKKMLRTLDVDSFLNKIHADTSIGRK